MSNKEKRLARERAAKSGNPYALELVLLRKENAFRQWLEEVIEVAGVFFDRWKSAETRARQARLAKLALPPAGVAAYVTTADDMRGAQANTLRERAGFVELLDRGTDDEIARLAAVAWIGRDDGAGATRDQFLGKYAHALEMLRADGRASMVRYLATKPLREYLADGLRVANRIGFDVTTGFRVSGRGPAGDHPLGSRRPPPVIAGGWKRLRAINAVLKAPDSEGRYQVRPFEHEIDRGTDVPTSMLTGRIEGQTFVVSVFGAEVPVATNEVGKDKRGPYAIVAEGEYPLGNDFFLLVTMEPQEDGLHGCEIGVCRRVGNWIDPQCNFAVYFGAGGVEDGSAGGYPLPRVQRTVN